MWTEVTAGPGQIRIRNYAAAVNPTDVVAGTVREQSCKASFRRPTCQVWTLRELSTKLVTA